MGEMISHTIEGQAFLGAMAETESAKKVEWVSNNMVNVLHFRPGNDEDRKKVSDYSRKIINGLGFEADTVNNLKLVENDESKTPGQKEIAKENLEILAKGTFLAMQKSMDTEVMDLLGQGSAVEIDNFLPEPLEGLGERVVKNVISNEIILNRLRDLDDVRENCDLNNSADKKILLDEISQTYADLTKMRGLNQNEKDQLYMVKAYLNTKMQTLDSDMGADEKKGEEGEVVTELQKVRKLNEERIAQKRKEEEEYAELRKRSLEQARYETFQAMLLHKNPITLDVFQQYAPEWMREEKDKPLMQTLVALANSCFYKWKYGDTNLDVMVDPRGEATFNAPNEMMQKMYEIPGVRQTMESIVRNYFEPGEEDGLDKNDEEKKIFVLRLKGTENGNVDKVVSQAQNIGDEQTKLVDDLILSGSKKSDAMLAVSTAFNLLYVGHIFEDADINRKLDPCDAYVEQMRAFIFPATKARSKFGLDKIPVTEKSNTNQKESVGTEEGWGGQLGQWLTEVVIRARHKVDDGVRESDPDIQFYRRYKRGEVHPFPERLFAGFLTLTEVEVKTKDDRGNDVRQKMSVAEALYGGFEIDFEAKGKGVNPWGSYYDVSDSANKLYKIVKGDQKAYPLPLGDMRELQQVANWAHEVSDARNKVKRKDILRPHVEGREFMKWIIAACVQGGIFPYSAELVLMTPDVNENQDVSFDGLLKRRDLLEKEEDKKWLKKEFHAENYGSKFIRGRIIKGLGKNRRRY
ncbi:MAG TPA: hypothetical protein PKI92_00420 [Candidatus Woesebacteria bacterium]|nr:hypothetical protein [Candidatus Woesebacteria bacterium]HPR99343.1 hypothetical protein [Candidatus Woesebacteria bacterium]